MCLCGTNTHLFFLSVICNKLTDALLFINKIIIVIIIILFVLIGELRGGFARILWLPPTLLPINFIQIFCLASSKTSIYEWLFTISRFPHFLHFVSFHLFFFFCFLFFVCFFFCFHCSVFLRFPVGHSVKILLMSFFFFFFFSNNTIFSFSFSIPLLTKKSSWNKIFVRNHL